MELLLNLLWLLVAVTLLGTWRTQWIHQRRRTIRHCLQEWSAVSLALVLLFFAVSMTDDLHSEIVALEDCSAGRRDPVWTGCVHLSAQSSVTIHPPVWSIVWRGPSFRRAQSDRRGLSAELFLPPFWSIRPGSSRAPPVSLL
jgi:hypothetical protein